METPDVWLCVVDQIKTYNDRHALGRVCHMLNEATKHSHNVHKSRYSKRPPLASTLVGVPLYRSNFDQTLSLTASESCVVFQLHDEPIRIASCTSGFVGLEWPDAVLRMLFRLKEWWRCAELIKHIATPPQTIVHNKKSLAKGDRALFIVEVRMKDAKHCNVLMTAIAVLVVTDQY